MEPFEQQFGRRRNINYEAIGAFVVAMIVAFFVQKAFGLIGPFYRPNGILTALVVCGIGGFWYQIRKII
jgi:hypothetical protein